MSDTAVALALAAARKQREQQLALAAALAEQDRLTRRLNAAQLALVEAEEALEDDPDSAALQADLAARREHFEAAEQLAQQARDQRAEIEAGLDEPTRRSAHARHYGVEPWLPQPKAPGAIR
jgi:hypothetical protein